MHPVSGHAHFVACVILVEVLLRSLCIFCSQIMTYPSLLEEMTDKALLILTEKETAPSRCHYGCHVGAFKLSKLSGRMATKEVHPCLTLSTPSNQLIHIEAVGWRHPSDTHTMGGPSLWQGVKRSAASVCLNTKPGVLE